MIKLKLNRDQLFVLFTITNPAIYEAKVAWDIKKQQFGDLNFLFSLIEIGEIVSKKWLYTNQNKNSVSLSNAQAASLMRQTYAISAIYQQLSYEHNVLLMIRCDLHSQLSNYQRKFYGEQQYTSLSAGQHQAIGGTVKNITG